MWWLPVLLTQVAEVRQTGGGAGRLYVLTDEDVPENIESVQCACYFFSTKIHTGTVQKIYTYTCDTYVWNHTIGQIIATSHHLTPKCSWGRELFQGSLGCWNIMVWPDTRMFMISFQVIHWVTWIPPHYFKGGEFFQALAVSTALAATRLQRTWGGTG